MTFSTRHRLGDCETNPPLKTLDALYDELLEDEDEEHDDVSVEHEESEICLVAHRSGLLVREDYASERTRHLKETPRERVVELWKALAKGNLDRIDGEPWQDGRG